MPASETTRSGEGWKLFNQFLEWLSISPIRESLARSSVFVSVSGDTDLVRVREWPELTRSAREVSPLGFSYQVAVVSEYAVFLVSNLPAF